MRLAQVTGAQVNTFLIGAHIIYFEQREELSRLVDKVLGSESEVAQNGPQITDMLFDEKTNSARRG